MQTAEFGYEKTEQTENAVGWAGSITHEQCADERDVPVAGGEEERRDVGVDLLVHGSRLGGSALPRLCLSDAP
jgi:hypothetical protein